MGDEVQQYLRCRSEGYVVDKSTDTSAWSSGFKKYVLIPLGIYEPKKIGLHSLRNTAINFSRQASFNGEIRKALVAHEHTDAQDGK